MTNTIFNHDLLESSNYVYEDYTSSKYTDIHEMDELKSSGYISYIRLEDDAKIEYESFKLYGTEDYWDLLIAINHMDPLFDSPYNFDILIDEATKSISNYTSNVYIGTLPAAHVAYLTSLKQAEIETQNEAFRTIKVIRPEKLQDFLKILRDQGKI